MSHVDRLVREYRHWIRQLVLCLLTLVPAAHALATTVRMTTSLGNIDIVLFDSAAPKTVANFLAYVNEGAYDSSFIHRSVRDFVVQGGGYRWNVSNDSLGQVTAKAPVANEFSPGRSNVRGTLAMAKLPNNPDSATNQWFFNIVDNSSNLDLQNGGFTVFGQVTAEGMTVVDKIAALQTGNIAPGTNLPFDSVPLPVVPTVSVKAENLVIISKVEIVRNAVTLAPGWNLVGNGTAGTLGLATAFPDPARITSVWKWDAGQGLWAFHAPSLAAAGTLDSYAASKGYQVLNQVMPGEGFWVNAKEATAFELPAGATVMAASLSTSPGWNLVSAGDRRTPREIGAMFSSKLTSLWAWDTQKSGWYFHAPSLDAAGTLSDYIATKGYLDFAAGAPLGMGKGFWINRQP